MLIDASVTLPHVKLSPLPYVDDSGRQQTVAIPPSLLISALGQINDIRQAVTMDLKEPGNLLFLVGPNTGLGHNSIVHMIESQVQSASPLLNSFVYDTDLNAPLMSPIGAQVFGYGSLGSGGTLNNASGSDVDFFTTTFSSSSFPTSDGAYHDAGSPLTCLARSKASRSSI